MNALIQSVKDEIDKYQNVYIRLARSMEKVKTYKAAQRIVAHRGRITRDNHARRIELLHLGILY